MSNSSDDVDYFATSGPATDLSKHAARIAQLPADPAALGDVVRGLLMHNWTAAMKGIESSAQRDGMKIVGAGPTIDRVVTIDDRPLDEARPEAERLIGFCYHFALVHCALLRAKGVPARARCGFANYLADGIWTDHWVLEYWDGEQWRLNDSQIGLNDLSHDHFRDGVRAWQMCRNGLADPNIHGNGELWGWDELRGTLVNDVGALNKTEAGDWDWCDFLQVEPLDQPDSEVDGQLDVIADLAADGRPISELHAAFEKSTKIRPPKISI